ncbi:MAG: hypothetical protein KIT31_38430, partial [Deltaproteobacteria bacterium]|nr:hypothetical protein [Deltaproteobacteria bacterium]
MSHRALSVLLAALALVACGDNTTEHELSPRISIVSPATGSVLVAPTASLVFRVEDAAATGYTLAIGDGAPATVTQAIAAGAEITTPLALAGGVNTITLGVLDARAAVADRATLVLVAEVDADPVVELTAPAP